MVDGVCVGCGDEFTTDPDGDGFVSIAVTVHEPDDEREPMDDRPGTAVSACDDCAQELPLWIRCQTDDWEDGR